MANTILELIRAGGPIFGPLLFIITLWITFAYHSLQRRGDIRDFRLYMALVDKRIFTVAELRDYGVLPQVDERRGSAWEGVL
jgi:hypothetical protein